MLGALWVGDPGADATTVALAVTPGIGSLLYGLAFVVGIIAATREPGQRFPIVGVILAATVVIVGLLLVLDANSGIESLKGTFQLLGMILLVAGVALVGWGLRLRQQQTTEPEAA